MLQGIQQIPVAVDWAIHSGETVAIVGACIAVIRRQAREESIRKNFPPHKHVVINAKETIMYPVEYPPSKTEDMP